MVYMIGEMYFECLFFDIIAKRQIQKPNQKSGRAFLQKQLTTLAVDSFCKKFPSQIFDWVLNRLWTMSEVSLVEYFYENSSQFTVFGKNSILNVRLGSKYASVECKE